MPIDLLGSSDNSADVNDEFVFDASVVDDENSSMTSSVEDAQVDDGSAGEFVFDASVVDHVPNESVITASKQFDPDKYAKAKKLGERTGLPTDTVYLQFDNLESHLDTQDKVAILNNNPVTRDFFQSPEFARMAHGDVENLGIIEGAWRDTMDEVRSLPAGFVRNFGMAAEGLGEVYNAVGRRLADPIYSALSAMGIEGAREAMTIETGQDYLPGNIVRNFGLGMNAIGDIVAVPKERQTFATQVAEGLGQVTGQAVTAFTTGGFSSTASLLTMIGQGAATQAEGVQAAGKEGEVGADAAIIAGGAVTAITERYGLDLLFNRIPASAKNWFVKAVMSAGSEGSQEIIEGIVQDATAKGLYDPERNIWDVDAMTNEGGVGGTVGAITSLVQSAVGRSLNIRSAKVHKERAQKRTDAVRNINNSESRLREQSPEQYAALQASHMRNVGVESVHVDQDGLMVLNQLGYDPFDLSNADDMSEVQATGATVQISPEKFWTLPKEAIDAIAPHVTFSDSELTEAQAEEAERISKTVFDFSDEDMAAEIAGIDEENKFFTNIYDQLKSAGHTDDRARANAEQMVAAFSVMSKRSGVAFDELVRMYGPKINKSLPETYTSRPIDQQDLLIDRAKTAKKIGLGANIGESLIERISRRGGIVDTGGELASMDADKWHKEKPFRKKFVRDMQASGDLFEKGQRLDNMFDPDEVLKVVIEDGYLPEGSSIDDLYNAIREEMAGQPHYIFDASNQEQVDEANAIEDLIEFADRYGIDLDQPTWKVKEDISKVDISADIDGDMSYEQPQHGDKIGALGSVNMTNIGSIQINLFRAEDLSTFLHESGHLYLQMMSDLVNAGLANEQMVEDMRTIRTWLGIDPDRVMKRGQGITREQHETFAETYEAYLKEGVAPSRNLRYAFARFSAWLAHVYKKLSRRSLKRADLKPEIRDVMDRLLATEDEIRAARTDAGIVAAFTSLEESGMTEDQYNAYKESVERARLDQNSELMVEAYSEVKRGLSKWWRAERELKRKEIIASLDSNRVWVARSVIQENRMPSGAVVPAYLPSGFKLSRAAVEDIYGKGSAKYLPGGARMYRAEGGVDPEDICEAFGYSSGQEMINDLMSMPKGENNKYLSLNKFADIEAERLMKEEHGDILNDGTIHERALLRVHGESQLSVLQRELTQLNKLAGKKGENTPNSVIREAVKLIVSRKNVGEVLSHRHYLNAEHTAGVKATEAVSRGDLTEAIEQKRRQILNFHMYRQCRDEAKKIESRTRYMRDLQNKVIDPKRVNPGFITQIKKLLSNVSFTRAMSQKREDAMSAATLQKWADEQTKEYGAQFVIPAELDAALNRRNYTNMTLDEFNGLHDTVKSLLSNGTRYNKAEQRQFKSLVGNIASSIKMNAKKIVKTSADLYGVEKVTKAASAFLAEHRQIQSLCIELDGGVYGGSVYENIYLRVKHADDRYIDRSMKAAKEINDIFTEAYSLKDKAVLFTKGVFIPEIGESMRLGARLAFALNMGNAGNVEAIKNDYSDAQINAVLRTLTDSDWDVVEKIWAHIDQYWDELSGLEERVTGVKPEKVIAVPFVTPTGRTVSGGYYPLVADPKGPEGMKDFEERRSINNFMNGGHAKASTKHGSTIERKGWGKKRKVWLDINVAFNHVDGVIKDIEMREAIADVHRIVNTQEFIESVSSAKGVEYHTQFKHWLENVVGNNRQPKDGLEKTLQYARSAASIAEMGLSLRTMGQQVFGLTMTVPLIGEKYVKNGVVEFARDRKRAVEKAMSLSVFMKNRAATMNRDVKEASQSFGVRGIHANIVNYSFKGIQMFDMAVAVPSWLGAYQKAQDEGMIGQDAVDYADSVVARGQGSGLSRELSNVQQGGPFKRIFTMFYTFFNAYYNIQVDMAKELNDKRSVSAALKYLKNQIWVTLIPALVTDYLFNGGPDDEEDWADWIFSTTASFAGGGLVLVRDIINATTTGFSYNLSPAGGMFKYGTETVKQVNQGDADLALVNSLIMALGYGFHIPGARQTQRINKYIQNEGTNDLDTFEGWWDMLMKGKD